MAPRTRNRSAFEDKGLGEWHGEVYGGYPVYTELAWVSDFTGPGDCSPLDIGKITISGGRINRPLTDYRITAFKDYRCDRLDTPNVDHLWLPDSPSDVTAATEAAARTNPSRPYVDVAANLLELGNIVSDIRKIGTKIINRDFFKKSGLLRSGVVDSAGSVNLSYSFGIAPLVGDIVKLSQFQNAFDRRTKEVLKLRTDKGYRKTVDIGVYRGESTFSEVMQSFDLFVRTSAKIKTKEGVRVHTRWVTDEDPSHLLPDAKLVSLIRKALVNYNPLDPSALWEAVPWSWFIDWCGNVGQYFKATRNILPARLDGVHVMRHTKTEVDFEPTSSENWTLSAARIALETKKRHPSFVAPIAHFPYLSAGQMGILASLAVTRS